MDFDFSAEQHTLRDVARDLFQKESPPTRLRSLLSGEERDRRVWQVMAEVGLLGITVSEEFGGLGGNEIDLALVLEEAGHAALPEPLVETVAIAAPMLAEAGTDAQRAEWLPKIASGEAIVTVMLAGAEFAVEAGDADLLLVERSDGLYAVPRTEFDATPVDTVDGTRRLFTVEARTSDASRMAGDAAGAFERGAFATACVSNGVSLRLLQMSLAHVKERNQFGRPVGSFQAVKHKLASAQVLLEAARASAWYAAYAIAHNQSDRHPAASTAKATATTTASYVNTEALQTHGGIGFTWEHDLGLWLKRGRALEQSFGNAAFHHARLAAEAFNDA